MGIFHSIKKSRRQSSDIDEKIEYLNKELEKTGLQEVMTTSNMYVSGARVPNQAYNDFNGLSQGGYALGLSADEGDNFGGAGIGINPSTGQTDVALSPPHPVTGVRRVASTVTDGIGSNRALRPGKGTRVRGTNDDGTPKTVTDGSAVWFYDSAYNSGEGRWLNFEWLDGELGFWDTNFLGFFFHNTNLDEYQLSGSNVGTQIKNKIAGINFGANGSVGTPETLVLQKNDLDDPNFLPINIDGMSPQTFDSLFDKAIAKKYKTEDEMWDAMADFLMKDAGQNPADDPFSRKGTGMDDRWIGPPVDKAGYELEGQTLSEGVKLGHFEPEQLNVDIEQLRKGIMPEFPKDPPPEMVNGYNPKSRLAPKKVEGTPFIKVTRKDLAKNHLLTDREIGKFLFKVKLINEYIKNNPADLIYAQTRYPKSDPRLAQLNWEMDQKLNASKEYMDKHYPENQKLFTKVQKSIKKNIELTDPKSFKGVKVPKFKGVDLTDFKRRKEVVVRHYKKAVKTKKLFSRKKT